MEEIRAQFPALAGEVHGRPLVYLDNAASTQVPKRVLDAMRHYYESGHANIDRGVHYLGQRATRKYEESRERVAGFIGAVFADEIIFVRGTTEAANLVAAAYLGPRLCEGDHVVVTDMEHHSNYLPWHQACVESNAKLNSVRVLPDGSLDMEHAAELLKQPGCRMLAITHVSNVLGTVNPVQELVALAHESGVPVFVDGAQAVPHLEVNVRDLGCDFYAFSGHKVHGPTGIGVLYASRDKASETSPWQTGGGMVRSLRDGHAVFNEPPSRFEAGTPNIVGAIGLAEAIAFLQPLLRDGLQEHESGLLQHLEGGLSARPRVRLLNRPPSHVGVASFVYDGVHAHDVGSILDAEGVAVRVGHHCAIPLMHSLGIPAAVRVSLAAYNDRSDIDAFLDGLGAVDAVFSGAPE